MGDETVDRPISCFLPKEGGCDSEIGRFRVPSASELISEEDTQTEPDISQFATQRRKNLCDVFGHSCDAPFEWGVHEVKRWASETLAPSLAVAPCERAVPTRAMKRQRSNPYQRAQTEQVTAAEMRADAAESFARDALESRAVRTEARCKELEEAQDRAKLNQLDRIDRFRSGCAASLVALRQDFQQRSLVQRREHEEQMRAASESHLATMIEVKCDGDRVALDLANTLKETVILTRRLPASVGTVHRASLRQRIRDKGFSVTSSPSRCQRSSRVQHHSQEHH
uniref:Uncharacterized protein n=1 Tax=Noctiluca scintillans TaxID=2966 RepID=A0A7S0ZVC5_NOCSC